MLYLLFLKQDDRYPLSLSFLLKRVFCSLYAASLCVREIEMRLETRGKREEIGDKGQGRGDRRQGARERR